MELSTCPICNLTVVSHELEIHANEHFTDEDYAGDVQLAQQISIVPPSPPPILCEDGASGQDTFQRPPSFSSDLQTTYSTPNPNRTACGPDEKYYSLLRSQNKETKYQIEVSLMNLLRKCLESDSDNSVSILSGHVDHFQSIYSLDAKWGCGWRNIQMLSSHLIKERQEARDALFGGSGYVPDISSLQRWLELAWEKGFDTAGSDDFDRKIHGKKAWIGTTECAALLRFFGLRARIVDFSAKLGSSITGKYRKDDRGVEVYGPMDMFLANGKLNKAGTRRNLRSNIGSNSSCDKVMGHQALIDWVWSYFSGNSVSKSGNRSVVLSEKAPLYFQHDGHSRTIVGIQAKRPKEGTQQFNLLIFDPAEKTRALEKSLRDNVGWQKLIKRGVHTLRKSQYQLCFVDPGIASGEELENLKILRSILIDINRGSGLV